MDKETNWKSPDFEHELSNEPYQFYLVGVKRRASDGKLFWSTDSGCSCPSPWEDHTEADWSPLDETWPEFVDVVNRGETDGTHFIAQIKELKID